MKTLAWSSDLAVGLSEIDEQHKTWIQRFNDVATAIDAKRGATEIGRTLDFLSDYTREHFATEERLMAAAGYPALQAHLSQHRELDRDARGPAARFPRGGRDAEAGRDGGHLPRQLAHHAHPRARPGVREVLEWVGPGFHAGGSFAQ
ncbi:MAG: hemerythrin domain-containing protein [Myxococcales bacterium]